MLRWVGALAFALVWLLAVSTAFSALASATDAPTYELSRTIAIPLKSVDATQSATAQASQDPATLLASPGAEDELPEGPNGFEVLEDGRLLISDPLAFRVVVFDTQGKYRESWKLSFPPDSLTLVGKQVVAIRDASTGQLHGFGLDGRPQSLPQNPTPPLGEVMRKSGNLAYVTLASSSGTTTQALQISFDRPGMSLVSVEILAVEKDGNAYLALESTSGGDEVSIEKDVRKYSNSGKFLGQIVHIPLDYYIPPINELRVRDGVIYQLYTTKAEVRVNIWNTK
jgi:hypothetical protein